MWCTLYGECYYCKVQLLLHSLRYSCIQILFIFVTFYFPCSECVRSLHLHLSPSPAFHLPSLIFMERGSQGGGGVVVCTGGERGTIIKQFHNHKHIIIHIFALRFLISLVCFDLLSLANKFNTDLT